MAPKPDILLVEDDGALSATVREALELEGYGVTAVSDGAQAIAIAAKTPPTLILLDLNLPSLNGIEVCRQLKQLPQTRRVPVIFLTARSAETDVVLALGLGGDDYVRKPFHIAELVARVQAVLRRKAQTADSAEETPRLIRGPIEMDSSRLEAKVDGNPISLTLTEFRILWKLISAPGVVQTRDQLLDSLGGGASDVVDRNIDVHIAAIRKKLGSSAKRVATVRGMGYKYVDD